MICGFDELRRKEVIDIKTGERLGYIDDIEISIPDGKAVKLIIYGCTRFFGILGKEDDVFINCSDIKVIGSDTVLVETAGRCVDKLSTKKQSESSESLSE